MAAPVLLLNPQARRARWHGWRLARAAAAADVEVRELGPDEDFGAVARAVAAQRPDALAVAGGDGSLAPVAAVAIEFDLPFAVVPLGTRNHFARDAGLDRRRPLTALAALTDAGEERAVDVGRVGGQLFLNNVSLGVYADAVHEAAYRRHPLVTAWRAAHVHENRIVLVANNAYELDGAPVLGVRQRLDAGLLQVCVLEAETPLALARGVARVASGRHALATEFRSWTCWELDLGVADEPPPAAIDGEPVTLAGPLVFRSDAGALRLLVPPGTVPPLPGLRQRATA